MNPEEKALQEFRTMFRAEQLADADNRQMGSSTSLLRQWERESEECKPGGIVDQRLAQINARNLLLPERERSKRIAVIAKQKAAALRPGDSLRAA